MDLLSAEIADKIRREVDEMGFTNPSASMAFYRVEDTESLDLLIYETEESSPLAGHFTGAYGFHIMPEIDDVRVFSQPASRKEVLVPDATEAMHLASLVVHKLGYPATIGSPGRFAMLSIPFPIEGHG